MTDPKPTTVPNPSTPEKEDERCFIVYTDSDNNEKRILRKTYLEKEAAGEL